MKTNEEVIADIMQFGTPLNQVIVIQGLLYYTQQCMNDGAAKFDSPMLNGTAWVEACQQINAKLHAHLNGNST